MDIPTLGSRVVTYYKRHGVRATAQRASLALKRALFSNRHMVFYCDFADHVSSQSVLPSILRVDRMKSYDELSTRDLSEIITFWNPRLAEAHMAERFNRGACLWLIKSEERLAGYIWTLRGCTISPFYLPLGQNDVQFFDLFLFPRFRGRGIDWLLFTYVLHALATEGASRAFADTNEWNHASLASHAMGQFRRLGWARKFTLFHRTIVWWNGVESLKRRTKIA